MKKKQMQFQSILLLVICIMLSGCKKIDLPEWHTFNQEIKESYLDVNLIRLMVFNSPTLFIEVTGKNIDIPEKEEIMKKIVGFVLSDKGYQEMEEYFVESNHRDGTEFRKIQINFIDTDYDKSNDRIRYSSRKSDEMIDEDNRGFDEWSREDLENGTSEIIDIFNIQ